MLTVDGVTAGYHSVPVLRDVSLRAETGQVVAVLGANGAGKTSLLRVISGLLPLQAGTISLDGEPIHQLPAHRIARRGLVQVVEARGVLPGLTVEENILLGLLGRGRVRPAVRQEAIERATTYFPWIGERLRAYGAELSGGQQQMVALSRALALDPPTLLLDEPSLGIAPALVEEIYERIALAANDARTVIIVEQHVHKVLAVADRAYVLRRGAVVLHGDVAELRKGNRLEEAYLS
jgi:branched-chain amino acid transport system ATP-binding protein